MTFSEVDTKRDVVSGIHRDVLTSKFPLICVLQGSNDFDDCREDLVEGGKCAAPKSAMPHIEKERSLVKPNQLPAGPRKKRPLGRLFSSISIIY